VPVLDEPTKPVPPDPERRVVPAFSLSRAWLHIKSLLAAGRQDSETAPEGRASVRIERAAQIVTIVATVWFALAVGWGLFERVGGGHEVQLATRAIVAENMRHWHILAPVRDYWLTRPAPVGYYVHHPWGAFWMIAAFAEVLGRGTWVPRLVGVLMSIAIPPLLYGIGRILWGPVAGAVSALAYVVLPIALAFGNIPGFELPVSFSCLLAAWGYLRFAQRWQRRWMVVSVVGMLLTVNSDWQGCIFIGTVLVSLAAGGLLFARWFGRVPLRPFALWWVSSALVTAASVLGYYVYFRSTGTLGDLFRSETLRSRGSDNPLSAFLSTRSYWIDVTFTPLAVTIGKIAAPIFVARVLVWRRLHEIFPLAILLMAVVEYVKFPNGANVHIYWPLPFAPYWALSLGMLSAVAIRTGQCLLSRSGREGQAWAVHVSALAMFGVIALRVLPDGIQGLRYAKATAGRFNEKGRRIFNDADMAQAMEWMAARMEPNTVVAMLTELSKREYRGQEWALHRPVTGSTAAEYFTGKHLEPYFVSDLRFMTADDQQRAARFHLVTLGPYLFVDRREPAAPLDAYTFDEREPTFFEWYLESPTEPIRAVRPDPWTTWELREHYGQSPNPTPAEPPKTLEEIRIAHNVAVATGDAGSAEKWRTRLLSDLDTSVGSSFSDGTHLLGERFVRGVDPKLELYFEAKGPLAAEYLFEVLSHIEAPPTLSIVRADEKTKKYGPPFVISPRLWRAGFIYLDRVDVRHRPGRERFIGFFDKQDPASDPPPQLGAGDDEKLPLMTIE